MPLPSSIPFFITQNGFTAQLANKAFGPQDENNFRLTSGFIVDLDNDECLDSESIFLRIH